MTAGVRKSHGLRAAGAARKGGTPGEGSPFDPLLRFISIRGVPRAAARGQGSAPGPRPLFCKKAGQKTFKRQSTSGPNPSPLGRVIQSVREADTLAAEWHLPRERERRAGPETSRGRHHPISVFLWGSTPFLWARPKKWGGTCSTNVKSHKTKRRVPETHPRAGMEPHPYRDSHRTWTTATDMGFVQTAGKKQKWPAILRKRGNFASRALTKILPWRKIIKKFEARRRGLFD